MKKRRYAPARKYRLTELGCRMFPILKNKVFEVRVYLLNPEYCQARVKGRKAWGKYWYGYFRKVTR